MSTIFGQFKRNKEAIERCNIKAMDEALAYWSSDDKGIWSKGAVSLGHLMTWNTPESKLEHLPRVIHPENQTLAITIDARLDNRETLAQQLEMSDLPLGKITDSELILAAYQKWGETCPEHLLGDFAFAIWDANKERLFCARDHIGIKPFYYHLSDDLFVFCNDIRGLIAHPEISKNHSNRSIAMFLAGDFGFYDEKETLFAEIRKLPAAATLTITNDHTSESTYWNIQDIPELHYDTYEEYTQKLRELLEDAVKVRLRTAYPVASHLSGGIDSSAIAVLAARELKKRDQSLYAFNWIETPDGEHDPDYSEWGFATQIAGLENIEQKNIKLTAEFIAEMYDKVDIAKEDISFFWGEYLVRDEAEKYKVRTFLSGWGGDELISYDGYAYLSGLFRQGHFIKAIQKIHAIYSFKEQNYKHLRMVKKSLREIIYPFFYKQMSGLYQEGKSEYDHYQYTRDQFSSTAREFAFTHTGFSPGAHNEQKVLFNNGHLLQRIENWASSALEKKLEYSYPLLDKRIVEFALAVPEDIYAWREGHQRYFFRSAVSDFLPKDIAWGAKNAEREHGEAEAKLWQEALRLWMQKNEKNPEKGNCYIDRSKIIKRLKIYFNNQDNGVEDAGGGGAVPSILMSNLKNKS